MDEFGLAELNYLATGTTLRKQTTLPRKHADNSRIPRRSLRENDGRRATGDGAASVRSDF